MRINTIILVWVISLFSIQEGLAQNKKKADMKTCVFSAKSISKTTLSGIKLSKGINFAVISEVGGILAGNLSSVPLEFIINLEVMNPNEKSITIQDMEYILRIDNVELTRGVVKKKLKIGGSKKKILPVPVSVDLSTLARSNVGNAVQNMVRNFMRTGARPTNISLQIKPSYKIGKEVIPSPRHIPVNFSFGGK